MVEWIKAETKTEPGEIILLPDRYRFKSQDKLDW